MGSQSPHRHWRRVRAGLRVPFELEAEKLDGWADDLKVALEREIKDMDRQIKEAKRAATLALTLEEKLAGQKQIKALESQRNGKRRALFDAQDDIDRHREQLISEIEGKLNRQTVLVGCLQSGGDWCDSQSPCHCQGTY